MERTRMRNEEEVYDRSACSNCDFVQNKQNFEVIWEPYGVEVNE
jgi:hypothetical protein